jgi:hypothetical protein
MEPPAVHSGEAGLTHQARDALLRAVYANCTEAANAYKPAILLAVTAQASELGVNLSPSDVEKVGKILLSLIVVESGYHRTADPSPTRTRLATFYRPTSGAGE